MDTKNLTVLVNDEPDVNNLPRYIVVNTDDIVEGRLCDTYGLGPQWWAYKTTHEEAGDFCLGNEASAMADEIKQHLVENGLVDCGEEDIEVTAEGEVTINGKEHPGLRPYAEAYDEENREFTGATYVNYTKNENGMSLILKCDLPEAAKFHRLGTYMSEDSTLASINNALALFPGDINNPGIESVVVDDSTTIMTTESGVVVKTNPSWPWVAEVDA